MQELEGIQQFIEEIEIAQHVDNVNRQFYARVLYNIRIMQVNRWFYKFVPHKFLSHYTL